MKRFFIGYLFIYLNLNIQIENMTVDFLPGFVGYYFILKGLTDMAAHSHRFDQARTATVIMLVWSGIEWVLAAIGISMELGVIGAVLGIVGMLLALYISWCIVSGILDTEEKNGWNLYGSKLMSAWKALAVMNVIGRLLALFAVLWSGALLETILLLILLVTFVMAIIFVVYLYKGWKQYEVCSASARIIPDTEVKAESETDDSSNE